MRRLIIFLTLVLLFALPSATTQAQSQTYTSDKVEFTLELPSPIWRMISA